MKSSRWVAVLLLLAVAATAPISYYFYSHRTRAVARTAELPELLSLASPDASYLFYADLATLRSAPFWQRLVSLAPAAPADREYSEFVRATGFDYSRDLDRVVLTLQPAPSANITVALADGRFDRQKISAYALRSGKIERRNDAEMYVVPSSTRGNSTALLFLTSGRLALADGPNGAALLAPFVMPNVRGSPEPAMRERISRVAGAAIFAVGRVSPIPENFSLGGLRSDQIANLARNVRWLTLAARPAGDRLQVAVEGECDTLASAVQLNLTLEALRLFGKAALADPKTRQQLELPFAILLDRVLQDAVVSRDAQRVQIRMDLTPQMLEIAARSNSPPPQAHTQTAPRK